MVSRFGKMDGFDKVSGEMLQNMTYVIDAFNRNLLQLLKQGGRAYVLSDIIEENRFVEKSKEAIQKEIEAYEKAYGIGLGSYGLMNMSEYAYVVQERYYQWRFSQERSFLLRAQLFQKGESTITCR